MISNPKQASFTSDEVAALLIAANESGDRVYALLSGIRAMLPLDVHGEPDDPSLMTLVNMALEEVADIGYQSHIRNRLDSALLP